MRFSRTAWLILGIGISAIIIGSVGWFYFQKAQEQRELDNRLSLAQVSLPTVISQRSALESQLTQMESDWAQAESSLAQVTVQFPESVESIEYDEVLFDIADDCVLKIKKLTASEPGEEEIEGITYSITSFTVKVEGTVAHILKFIETIATGDYSPGETNFVNASINTVTMENLEPGEGEKPLATIRMDIYGYRGE